MTPTPAPPRRRAFATATALIMLALLASLTLLMTTRLRTQARRTSDEAAQAQLRQILHAGHLLAGDLPRVWAATGPQAQTLAIPLPAPLTSLGASATLTTRPGPDPTTASATLTANFPPRRAQETLTFRKTDEGWALTALRPE